MASNYFNPINILDTSNSQGLGSGGSLNVGGGISIGGDTYIGGKVAISGTTTSFSDNILILNENPSATSDTGILLQRFSQDVTNNNNYSGIIYSEIADEFRFGYATADTRGSITLNSFIPIRTNGVNITQGGLNATGNSNTVGNIFTTGGNVGIGTNSPVDTLDVKGTLRIGNSTQSNSIIFSGTFGDNQSISTGIGYTLIGERVYNSTEQSELLLFKGNDIASPSGPDRIRLLAGEHRFDTLSLGISGNIDSVGSHTSASNKMIITSSGNIGIGTTSPISKLDVAGSLNVGVSGQLYQDINIATDGGGIIFYGGAKIYKHYTDGLYIVPHDNSIGTQFRNASNSSTVMRVFGNGTESTVSCANLSANISISTGALRTTTINLGNSDGGHTLINVNTTNGNWLQMTAVNAKGTWSQHADPGDSVIRASQNLIFQSGTKGSHIYLSTTGNIGIGTTSPISTLDVKGSLSISGTNGSVTLIASTTGNEQSNYILPSNIPTIANTCLTTSSSGNMSWKLPYEIGDIAPKQMDSTFVEMNGQVLSQSTYPELYAAIGHNPEIKFNIKNLTQTLNTSTSLTSVTNVGRENIARNNNTIIVVGSSNAIFRSADNGVTWTHPVYYATGTTYTIIHYCAGTWNRWIIGSNGAVLADSTDDGITWTLRSSTNYSKYAMDFNLTNSIGIVVGQTGIIQRSTNGTTWSTITALNTNVLRSIVYANISGTHTWVTVGDSSTIGYSTNDGATFTLATGITAGIQFNIVIWVGGSINLFIAGGNTNNLWTSPDGITWTSRSGVSGNVLDMVKDHTDSYIVAATSSGVAQSTNGTTWTSTSLASTSSISYDSTNTTFLGVGTSRAWYAKVATFSTWTEYTTTFNRVYRASIPINGGGSILYTIDTGGIMKFNTSTNTESTVLSPVYSIKDIAYGNGIFVAIASDAFSSCFTSTDGNTWTYRRFHTAAAQNAFTGRRIKYLNGNFIILSTSTIIFTSTDGITWTQRTTPNTTKNDIIWTGTNYVACTSDNGQLIYSSNLSSWTAVSGFGSSVGTGIIIEDLTHLGNGTIIAVARFGCILKSTDHGVSWSLKRAPSISVYDFCSVAYSATDNELVAVTKTSNLIAYSTDQGDTWQTYQADTNYAAMQFNGVVQGNNDFIVYGRNSLMGFSSSGVTWEWTSPGGNFEIIDMIYADGIFLGAGLLNSATLWSTPIVVYSTNGKNWTIKAVPHSLVDNALPKQRIGYGNKKFILSSYLNLVSTNVWVGELQYDPSTEFQLSTQYFGSGNTKMWIKASN
uniref:Uncharacterized protein n=1 Tax=viral metagenome TaxID=1070528 RepID=A0A6C0DVX9_9ZZZZ